MRNVVRLNPWYKPEDDDVPPIAIMQPDHLVTLDPLYIAVEAGSEQNENGPDEVLVMALSTTFRGAIVIPELIVLMPAVCGHFRHGGTSVYTNLN